MRRVRGRRLRSHSMSRAQRRDRGSRCKALLAGTVAMLVGQSGVGKSTLTNALAPESLRPTRTISESTGEGRHTTVSTALFRIPGGGELIDSPGVRDYAPPLVEDANVQVGWPEILALAPQCRFNNCLHLREPGCAVTAAVAANELSPRRYESYKRLMNIMRGLRAGVRAAVMKSRAEPDLRRYCRSGFSPTTHAGRRAHARACRRRHTRARRRPARRARCGSTSPCDACASSAMTCAVASPSTVVFVARIASLTLPSASSASSCANPSSSGPMPSSGDRWPISTKYVPR